MKLLHLDLYYYKSRCGLQLKISSKFTIGKGNAVSEHRKMASMQRDYSSHVWFQCLLLCLLLYRNTVSGDKNKFFHTSAICNHQETPSHTAVEGAVVSSDNELDKKCVMRFQTKTVLQKFMIRFEHLALDCNDHLYIFDGDSEYGKYMHDLSCRSTRTDVGIIFTRGPYLTMKYITDDRSYPGNGFKLVLTAFKSPDALCNFRCLNDLCISKNLTCDLVNHCGDNSDETSQGNCADETAIKQILGINFGSFVSIVLGAFLICCVCVVGVIICVFRKEAQQRQLETVAHLGTPHSVVVGQSPYPTEPTFSTPHCQLEEKPPPYTFLHQTQDGVHREGVYYHAK